MDEQRPTFPFPPRIDGEALQGQLADGFGGFQRALADAGRLQTAAPVSEGERHG